MGSPELAEVVHFYTKYSELTKNLTNKMYENNSFQARYGGLNNIWKRLTKILELHTGRT